MILRPSASSTRRFIVAAAITVQALVLSVPAAATTTHTVRAAATVTDPPPPASATSPLTTTSPSAPILPLQFERNVGQTDPHVSYLARTAGGTVFLTANGAVLALSAPPTTMLTTSARPAAAIMRAAALAAHPATAVHVALAGRGRASIMGARAITASLSVRHAGGLRVGTGALGRVTRAPSGPGRRIHRTCRDAGGQPPRHAHRARALSNGPRRPAGRRGVWHTPCAFEAAGVCHTPLR